MSVRLMVIHACEHWECSANFQSPAEIGARLMAGGSIELFAGRPNVEDLPKGWGYVNMGWREELRCPEHQEIY